MVPKQLKLYSVLFLNLILFFYACQGSNSSKLSKKTEEILEKFDGKANVIFQDKKNNFWFGGNDKGLYKYDGTYWQLFSKTDGLCSHHILGIQEDKLGNLYFDTSEGISKFDGQSFTTLEVAKKGASKNQWQLKPDDLWFRMGWDGKGPYRYDGQMLYALEFPKPSVADTFYAKYPNASFSPYGVYSMYKDTKGHMWFGTSSLGLCRFDGESIQWLYEHHLTETPSGGSFGIRAIFEDHNSHFWFCNTRYRYQIDSSSVSDSIHYQKEKGIEISALNNTAKEIYFMSVVEDSLDNLWLATYDDGVWCKKEKEFIHYPIKNDDVDVLLFSIYKDNQGSLWLTTQNAGVYKYNGTDFEPFKS